MISEELYSYRDFEISVVNGFQLFRQPCSYMALSEPK